MILKKINFLFNLKKQKQIQYTTCRNIQFLTHKKVNVSYEDIKH